VLGAYPAGPGKAWQPKFFFHLKSKSVHFVSYKMSKSSTSMF